jgi:AAA domain
MTASVKPKISVTPHPIFAKRGMTEPEPGRTSKEEQVPEPMVKFNPTTEPRPQHQTEAWRGYMPLSEARKAIGYTEQIIPNWLPDTGVSFIVGKRGDGKTLVLIDQALSFATDRDWMGIPTLPGRFSVYVCGEFPAGTLSLAEAWYKHHGIDPSDPTTRFMFVPRSVDLMKREDCEALVDYLKTTLPEGARPVIYVDTWQRATATGGQNEDTDMQTAMGNAEFIEKNIGGPVIAAAHPPKAKGKVLTILGSVVTENRSAAIWQLDRFPGKSLTNRQRTLSVIRNKSGGEGSSISLTVFQLPIDGIDSHGSRRTGAVVVKDGTTLSLSTASPSDGALDPEEEALLISMYDAPCLSFVKRAEAMDLQGSTGKPNDSHIKNKTTKLRGRGYVTNEGVCEAGDSYGLTELGTDLAKAAKARKEGMSVAPVV